MSNVYRIFIRHEMEAQPTWFKLRSEKSHTELISDLQEAMQQPAPALLQCTDVEGHVWVFRADKIYTICVYPPEPATSTNSTQERIDISKE